MARGREHHGGATARRPSRLFEGCERKSGLRAPTAARYTSDHFYTAPARNSLALLRLRFSSCYSRETTKGRPRQARQGLCCEEPDRAAPRGAEASNWQGLRADLKPNTEAKQSGHPRAVLGCGSRTYVEEHSTRGVSGRHQTLSRRSRTRFYRPSRTIRGSRNDLA